MRALGFVPRGLPRSGRTSLGSRPAPAETAAGTVLGEVQGGGPLSREAAAVPGAVLPSAKATGVPKTPMAGGIAPGELLDPSKPAYGVTL